MRFAVLLLLFVQGSVWVAYGQSTETKTTGDIQGTVVDAASNQGIRGTLVIIGKSQDSSFGTYTDAQGNFTFHDVDPGTYTLSAEHESFVADPKAERLTVTVAAGLLKQADTLKLNRTGAISGHVADASGGPVTGAQVQLQSWKARKNHPSPVIFGMTDDRGNYRAYNIPPGRYRLAVTKSSENRHLGIVMQKDKSKDSSAEAYGTTYYPSTLDVAQAAPLQVDASSDLQGIDIKLLYTRTVRVRGHVSGPNGTSPSPFVLVVLNSAMGGNSFDANARPDGTFEILQVPPGKYTISAIAMLDQGKQVTFSDSLEVGEADLDDVHLSLAAAQTVTGKVVIPADRKFPQGLILVLQLRQHPNSQLQVAGAGGFARVNENGAFTIPSVIPGDYDVLVANSGKGDDLYVSSVRANDQDILSSGLHVGATAPPPVEVVLRANGATVDSTVLDANQKPVPDAQVTLVPDTPRRSQLALRSECRTDSSGKCLSLGIAPGDYHAFASSKDDVPDFGNPEVMAGLENSGEPVTVTEGDQKHLQLKLLPLDQEN